MEHKQRRSTIGSVPHQPKLPTRGSSTPKEVVGFPWDNETTVAPLRRSATERIFSLRNTFHYVGSAFGSSKDDTTASTASVPTALELKRQESGKSTVSTVSVDDVDDPEFARTTTFYGTRSAKTIGKELKTDFNHGLTAEEVKERGVKYGKNELQKKEQRHWIWIFFDQYNDILIWMLLAATAVSFGTGEYGPAVVILLIVIANSIMGTVQNYKADKSLDALAAEQQEMVTVRRSGSKTSVPATEIVPGDVLIVTGGQVVAADSSLIKSDGHLKITEAALTGESRPVHKLERERISRDDVPQDSKEEPTASADFLKKRTVLYGGTNCAEGYGVATVFQTGMNSAMGKIAALLNEAVSGSSPLAEKLDSLGKKLGLYSFGISVVIFVMGIILAYDLLEIALVSVAVTVAAVPESLPAIITMGLARSMKAMAKKKVQARNISAVEMMGSATVICTDKTGTLTKGEMTARSLFMPTATMVFSGLGFQYSRDEDGTEVIPREECKEDAECTAHCLEVMAVCNKAEVPKPDDIDVKTQTTRKPVGNPTEIGMMVAVLKVGEDVVKVSAYEAIQDHSFSSSLKRMSRVMKCPDGKFKVLCKGGSDVVMGLCTHIFHGGNVVEFDRVLQQEFVRANENMAAEGLRVLALAYRDFDYDSEDPTDREAVESKLILVGLVGLEDPLRDEVPPAYNKAKRAGLRVIMMTGDHPATAVAIARKMGLVEQKDDQKTVAIRGDQFEKLSEEEQIRFLRTAKVVSRMQPQTKQKIVRILKADGHVTIMTGDGVNDAPALKEAHIGCAMGITGTAVAKGAADMVITDDNFASIVEAVEEGRATFVRLKQAVDFLITTNVAEVFLVLIAVLAKLPIPLKTSQILLLNLATDASPAIAMLNEKAEPGLMNLSPRHQKEDIIDRRMKWDILIQNTFLCFCTLMTFLIGLKLETGSWTAEGFEDDDSEIDAARSMAIYVILIAELLRAQTSRHPTISVFDLGLFSNSWMNWAVTLSTALLVLAGTVPGLQKVFNMEYLSVTQVLWVVLFSVLPFMFHELTKIVWRRVDSFKQWSFEHPHVNAKLPEIPKDEDVTVDDTESAPSSTVGDLQVVVHRMDKAEKVGLREGTSTTSSHRVTPEHSVTLPSINNASYTTSLDMESV